MSPAEIAQIKSSLMAGNGSRQSLGTPFADELEQLAADFVGCVNSGGFSSGI
ncbi:hypothetical protein OHA77_12025 [Streptosporangium sp. NBC_01639]|uniref:hypothetical protein n=1 Tax=Streptosporangium sp. NBC_01639 TaxID=2975948 RepID=UPI003863198F|nr:hypothetical protein OHA77_12025 [Streptosporangium sp. NBC_01639]